MQLYTELNWNGERTCHSSLLPLSPFSVNLNTTFVQSEVEMTKEEIAGRQISARDGEVIGDSRNMVGQSPYLVNLGINYLDIDSGWEGNLSFNTQGKRLAIVGTGQVPDVYEQPFNSLNLKFSKRIADRWNTSFGFNNILGSTKEKKYQAFEAIDQLFEIYQPGRMMSFSIGYNL